ncbi:MAG TPA: hypothetical protein VEX69_04720 [Candidatus Limnocylindria bacterium]|nr:hypothetical protein [Candidatus Limnocylindria bacterium]
MNLWLRVTLLAGITLLPTLPPSARGQTSTGAGEAPPAASSPKIAKPPARASVPYTRPTEKTKIQNYLFDSFGPYPIAGAAIVGAIQQGHNSPPEWNQGAAGYGLRVGSDFGIALVTTTSRYALAEIFREDTLYYRCECKGAFPRLRHALISTVTARRGDDGHRVFSVPALAAPYAGTMPAALGWYPARYNAEDGFRMGNYSLLAYAGGNIAIEFLYGGPHTLLSRMHLTSRRAAPSVNP